MEQMTVKQALEITIAAFEKIKVPMSEMQEIGFPLGQGINNLREILIAIERAEAKEAEKQGTEAKEDEIEVTVDGEN